MIRQIAVPLLIVYDPADNIQGKGKVTSRAEIAGRIKDAAVAAPRVDIAIIDSIPGHSPVEAHVFVGNEAPVVEKTTAWLRDIGLTPTGS
jgi:hypothetical protein